MTRRAKLVAFVILLTVIILLAHYFGGTEKFIEAAKNSRALAEDYPLTAMMIYILATSFCCVVLAMPGAFFAVVAGILFEPFTGTILCVIAATLGAVLAFLAGRYFLRDSVRPMIEKNSLLKKFLIDDVQHSSVILLMVTRLVPLFPYNLQNFAYGLTDIKLLPYTLYTFVFIAPGSAVFTLGAAGIGDSERRSLYLLIAVSVAIIVTIAGVILHKKFIRR